VQLLYHFAPKMASGSSRTPTSERPPSPACRPSGLALKAAADSAGRPIYLEMSSANPVFILPGPSNERPGQIAEELFPVLYAGGRPDVHQARLGGHSRRPRGKGFYRDGP